MINNGSVTLIHEAIREESMIEEQDHENGCDWSGYASIFGDYQDPDDDVDLSRHHDIDDGRNNYQTDSLDMKGHSSHANSSPDEVKNIPPSDDRRGRAATAESYASRGSSVTEHNFQPTETTAESKPIDVAGFARYLHENRLTLLQSQQQESRIVATEQDELELQKLRNKEVAPRGDEKTEISNDMPDSILLSKLNRSRQQPSRLQIPERQGDTRPKPLNHGKLSDPAAFTSPRPAPIPPPLSPTAMKPSRSRGLASMSTSLLKKRDSNREKRPSWEGPWFLKKKSSLPIQYNNKENDQSIPLSRLSGDKVLVEEPMTRRKSRFQEHMDVDISAAEIALANNSGPSRRPSRGKPQSMQKSPTTGPGVANNKPLGLFGSLKQATRARSQSTASIRGLVRNLSTRNSFKNSMSPAAAAALRHEADVTQKHDAIPANERPDPNRGDSNPETAETNNKGVRLLSQLLSRATKPKRVTKTVNMGAPQQQQQERAQVVRRTIIYVQPDSLNFLASIPSHGDSSDSCCNSQRSSTTSGKSDFSMKDDGPKTPDDGLPQFEVATMLAPPPHHHHHSLKRPSKARDTDNTSLHRLEGVELREMSDGSVMWGIVKKEGHRKSFYAPKQSETKGAIEEWIEEEEEETEEEIEERVLALMGLNPQCIQEYSPPTSPVTAEHQPPPLPKRSPYRPSSEKSSYYAKHIPQSHTATASNTDVYYAPQVTLPGLLEMISEQQHDFALPPPLLEKPPSLEERLDQAIHSLKYGGNYVF